MKECRVSTTAESVVAEESVGAASQYCGSQDTMAKLREATSKRKRASDVYSQTGSTVAAAAAGDDGDAEESQVPPKPSIAKTEQANRPAARAPRGPILSATLRVICTSPPGPTLNGFPVDLGLRNKTTKQIVAPTTSVSASCPFCSWEFTAHFRYNPARKTKSRNPFPGFIDGDYVESGKGNRNEDYYMYLRIMENQGKDYVHGLKITMGCITWQQVQQAQAPDYVIETRVPGPHVHDGMVTGQKQEWGGWLVVPR
jgi:hypothetical protein